jgi:hypothetical protein
MIQVLALKLAWCLTAFLWAAVSVDHRWGPVVTLSLVLGALALGASAAKDLARLGQDDDHV